MNNKTSLIDPQSCLIERGSFTNKLHEITEQEVEEVLLYVKQLSKTDPKSLFDSLTENKLNQHLVTFITPVILAMLLSYSDDSWRDKTKIVNFLSKFDAGLLLEFSLYFKNRWFGPGLGSSIQKMIKKAIENWNEDILEMHLDTQSKECYSLFKIIHPNFKGNKNQLVKSKLF